MKCFGILAFAALAAASATATAQTYPARPITVVVPFAAGGPGDSLMRAFSVALGKQLKQSVLIENAGGASGNVGVARVARATPDGYMLLYHNIAMATAPALYRRLEFNPLTDFEYVGMIASSPNVLVARTDFPASSVKELVAYLRANPEKVSIADAGIAGPAGLCALQLVASTGAKMTHVSYKGTAPAMNDLLGKQVDLLCDGAATAAPQIRAGKVKAFGISGPRRVSTLPDLATLDEQGLTGFNMVVWNALYAPKNTPKAVMDRLSQAFQAASADPDFAAYLEKVGSLPATREHATPAGLQAFLKSEVERWTPLLKKAGITLD